MSVQKNSSDFKAMNVAELKKYLQDRGISVSGYLKPSLVEIASAVKRMVLPVDPGISTCCRPQSSQAKAHPKRLFNLWVQAFPWC